MPIQENLKINLLTSKISILLPFKNLKSDFCLTKKMVVVQDLCRTKIMELINFQVCPLMLPLDKQSKTGERKERQIKKDLHFHFFWSFDCFTIEDFELMNSLISTWFVNDETFQVSLNLESFIMLDTEIIQTKNLVVDNLQIFMLENKLKNTVKNWKFQLEIENRHHSRLNSSNSFSILEIHKNMYSTFPEKKWKIFHSFFFIPTSLYCKFAIPKLFKTYSKITRIF